MFVLTENAEGWLRFPFAARETSKGVLSLSSASLLPAPGLRLIVARSSRVLGDLKLRMCLKSNRGQQTTGSDTEEKRTEGSESRLGVGSAKWESTMLQRPVSANSFLGAVTVDIYIMRIGDAICPKHLVIMWTQ